MKKKVKKDEENDEASETDTPEEDEENDEEEEETTGSFSLPQTVLASPRSSHVISRPNVSLPRTRTTSLEEEVATEPETQTTDEGRREEEEEFSYEGRTPGEEILYDQGRTTQQGELYEGTSPSETYQPTTVQGTANPQEQIAQEYTGRNPASTKAQAWVVGQRSEAQTEGVHWRDTHNRMEGETLRERGEDGFATQARAERKYEQ